jgi:hypothetical protein
MPLPRMSIRGVLFGAFLIAGDCATLRLLGGYARIGLVFGVLSVLPMANVLAVACYRSLARRASGEPFFVGFGVSGALLILVWFNLCLTADEKQLTAINAWFASILENIEVLADIGSSIENQTAKMCYYAVVNIFAFALLTAVPQLLVALSCGWLARRYAGKSRFAIPSAAPAQSHAATQ